MREPVVVERLTALPLDAAAVWGRITTPEGIRHELLPVASMTMPPGLRGRTVDAADELLGQPLGKAWVLLFGVLPVDYDDMAIVAYEPGRYFHERSRMLMLRRWEHERWVTPTGDGTCEVRDRLTFEPRLAPLAPLARRIVGALFTHRQRRLHSWCARQARSD